MCVECVPTAQGFALKQLLNMNTKIDEKDSFLCRSKLPQFDKKDKTDQDEEDEEEINDRFSFPPAENSGNFL
jgi:hypothetical protein